MKKINNSVDTFLVALLCMLLGTLGVSLLGLNGFYGETAGKPNLSSYELPKKHPVGKTGYNTDSIKNEPEDDLIESINQGLYYHD